MRFWFRLLLLSSLFLLPGLPSTLPLSGLWGSETFGQGASVNEKSVHEKSATDHYQEALEWEAQGRYGMAMAGYWNALRLRPDQPVILQAYQGLKERLGQKGEGVYLSLTEAIPLPWYEWALSGLASLLALMWVLAKRGRSLKGAGGLTGFLLALVLLGYGSQLWALYGKERAFLKEGFGTPRKGPGLSFSAVNLSLTAGQEAVLLEERLGWLRMESETGQFWLPSEQVVIP